jgi:hypothetical protein
MKSNLCILAIIMLVSTQLFAHSGRTDKYGGHNCSRSSQAKGLCIGYHYHKHEDPNYIMLGHEASKSSNKVVGVRFKKNKNVTIDR